MKFKYSCCCCCCCCCWCCYFAEKKSKFQKLFCPTILTFKQKWHLTSYFIIGFNLSLFLSLSLIHFLSFYPRSISFHPLFTPSLLIQFSLSHFLSRIFSYSLLPFSTSFFSLFVFFSFTLPFFLSFYLFQLLFSLVSSNSNEKIGTFDKWTDRWKISISVEVFKFASKDRNCFNSSTTTLIGPIVVNRDRRIGWRHLIWNEILIFRQCLHLVSPSKNLFKNEFSKTEAATTTSGLLSLR